MKYTKENCPFCEPSHSVIIKGEGVFAIFDKFPVSEGHALIIPQRHCSNYFELDDQEQRACWDLINKVKLILDDKYKPEGYNIGININEAAGQTVPHVHIHIIPRYVGDVENPLGGVRGVIPSKKEY